MYKKLIPLVSIVLVLSLEYMTYGIQLGDFENSMDGWGVVYEPNVSVSFSEDGATLGSFSLRIESDPNTQRVIAYDVLGNGILDEFRKNLKISLDTMRLESEWIVSGDVFCDLVMAINAGSSAAGNEWTFWYEDNLEGFTLDTDEPMSVTFDYSTILDEIDFDNLEYLELVLVTSWGRYDPGGVYYVDNIQVFGGGPAYNPSPVNGGRDLLKDITLSWTPGLYADKHDIYFSTNFNGVSEASRDDSRGVMLMQNYDLNTYDVSGLGSGKTYFWRVDEVNDAQDPYIWKGEIWSFTTAYPGGVYILGDWEDSLDNWHKFNQATPTGAPVWPPEYSTTGATLNDKSLKLEVPSDFWILQLDLNPEQLEALKANDRFALDVTWVTSEWEGHSWSQVQEIAMQGEGISWKQTNPGDLPIVGDTSNPDSPGNWPPPGLGEIDTRTITWDYSGIGVQSVPEDGFFQIFIAQNHSSGVGPGIFYFDNARLFSSKDPSNPNPANRAQDVKREPTLSWTPGVDAVSHDVYFGTDLDEVDEVNRDNLADYPNVTLTNVDVNSYKPGILSLNSTYCWRVDEVNNVHPNRPWKGDVWSFSTGDYLVVDDFEDYNDYSPDRIFDAWVDGWGVAENGSQVGHSASPFAERTIVHSGFQSMPFFYTNTSGVAYSEAVRTFDAPQDWTRDGVEKLTLFFRGYPIAFVEDPAGTYKMGASGADIWDVSDEFRFAYKTLSGDGSITTRVISIDNTDMWAKAGVMIRETLEDYSVHGFMCVTPSRHRAFQNRPIAPADTYSANSNPGAIDLPLWVRLVRQGNNITAYYSENGTEWIQQPDDENTGGDASTNPQIIVMRQDVYVGMAYTSHNATAAGTAVFSDVTTTGNVTGADWQVEAIGVEMPANDPAPLYIAVEGGGTEKVIEHPDNPNAVLQGDWQQWDIPLSVLSDAGVNIPAVQKMTIGVGSRTDPQDGAGTLYFDDIKLYRASP